MAVSQVTVQFPCPVERVWQTMTDLAHTSWRSDLAVVDVLDETHFVERTRNGYTTNFTIVVWEPPRRWVFEMENENMSGTWEGRFEVSDGGTWLTCTETVNAKRWWMRPFVPSYLKRQQKRYLDDLEKELLK